MSPADIDKLKSYPVYLVNLKYRENRLNETHETLERIGWTKLFQWPTTFVAWHGWKLPLPEDQGGNMSGAWGCKRSHEDCLADSIEVGFEGCILLEDDIISNRRDWAGAMRTFLEAVPDDWDQLMPGAQAWFRPSEPVNERVIRLMGSNRTHCYIVRDRKDVNYRKELLKMWYGNHGHCDHLMGAIQPGFKVYAPKVQLLGQRESWSDILGSKLDERHWIMGGDRRPVLVLHAPEPVVEELERRRLLNVVRPVDVSPSTLRPMLDHAQDDALSRGSVATVVHRDARAALVKLATDDPCHSVCGSTVEEVLERLHWEVREALGLGDE